LKQVCKYVGLDRLCNTFSVVEHTVFEQVFFVIHLQSLDFEPILAISDPDIFIPGDLMDTRASFLMFCRERRLEFSSLRRAKFSSMVILHRLHCEQEGEGGRRIFKCQMCSVKMTQCYTCSECEVNWTSKFVSYRMFLGGLQRLVKLISG
jgi:hypothetical protein